MGFLCFEATTHGLKRIIDKPRPNGGRFSFPSGHTSAAFYGASFLNQRYGLKVGIPSYLVASYVGYTRIKANKHDIYDVLAGADIGNASSLLFKKTVERKNSSSRINIDASFSCFNLVYSFAQ